MMDMTRKNMIKGMAMNMRGGNIMIHRRRPRNSMTKTKGKNTTNMKKKRSMKRTCFVRADVSTT
jgi:hypothetical protein